MTIRVRRRSAGLSILFALATAALASPAAAQQWSAVCSNIAGMRVDESGSEPAFADDSAQGATWTYTWNTATKKGSLTLPASHASDGKSHKQDGVVGVHRGGLFTIVSTLPGAVWIHAIYPETGRLLATQSATRSGTRLSGRMLVGTCRISR